MENYYLTSQNVTTLITAPDVALPEYLKVYLVPAPGRDDCITQHAQLLHIKWLEDFWQLTYYDQGKAKWHYRIDYEAQERIRRQQRRSALPDLVRACWQKNAQNPLIVDCCAGFGHDSVLLSLYGAQVIAFEQNPLIACLGQSALQHASLACPPQLQWGDGLKQVLALKPSCIYLDPMFDAEQLRTPPLKAQIYRLLHGALPTTDFNEHFEQLQALNCKIVVKRHHKANFLFANIKPKQQISGGRIRFDIY